MILPMEIFFKFASSSQKLSCKELTHIKQGADILDVFSIKVALFTSQMYFLLKWLYLHLRCVFY